ncbi:hypothetical protein C8R44DRAFT_800996 [Mycena epipterygia]|nr:hypothetical protein C8R44DRAFT_800996 [Mycena epipterygia]
MSAITIAPAPQLPSVHRVPYPTCLLPSGILHLTSIHLCIYLAFRADLLPLVTTDLNSRPKIIFIRLRSPSLCIIAFTTCWLYLVSHPHPAYARISQSYLCNTTQHNATHNAIQRTTHSRGRTTTAYLSPRHSPRSVYAPFLTLTHLPLPGLRSCSRHANAHAHLRPTTPPRLSSTSAHPHDMQPLALHHLPCHIQIQTASSPPALAASLAMHPSRRTSPYFWFRKAPPHPPPLSTPPHLATISWALSYFLSYHTYTSAPPPRILPIYPILSSRIITTSR